MISGIGRAVDTVLRLKGGQTAPAEADAKWVRHHGEWIMEFEDISRALPRREVAKLAKTTEAWLSVKVLGDIIAHAASHRRNEIGQLLIGEIDGRRLLVCDSVRVRRLGTAVNIEFAPADFAAASAAAAKAGLMVVGWAHSHPTYGCFYSGTDQTFQSQGQSMFPDWTGIVVDPFREGGGIELKAFRVAAGKTVRIPLHYVGDDNEA